VFFFAYIPFVVNCAFQCNASGVVVTAAHKDTDNIRRQCLFCRQDGNSKRLSRKEVNKTKR